MFKYIGDIDSDSRHLKTSMYTIVPGSVLPIFKSYLAKAVALQPANRFPILGWPSS